METKVEHTPEPWFISGQVQPVREFNLFCGSIHAEGEYRGDIASIQSAGHIDGWIDNIEAEANARRIVAAVNACKGIPTEALEGDRLSDFMTDTRQFLNRFQHKECSCEYPDDLKCLHCHAVGLLNALAKLEGN